MNRPTILAVGFVLFLLLAIYAAYAFAVGLESGVISCPGTRCGGASSLSTEPHSYRIFMSAYAITGVAMTAMAVLCLVQLVRGPPDGP